MTTAAVDAEPQPGLHPQPDAASGEGQPAARGVNRSDTLHVVSSTAMSKEIQLDALEMVRRD